MRMRANLLEANYRMGIGEYLTARISANGQIYEKSALFLYGENISVMAERRKN